MGSPGPVTYPLRTPFITSGVLDAKPVECELASVAEPVARGEKWRIDCDTEYRYTKWDSTSTQQRSAEDVAETFVLETR